MTITYNKLFFSKRSFEDSNLNKHIELYKKHSNAANVDKFYRILFIVSGALFIFSEVLFVYLLSKFT
jgi:hypothetical protein